MGSETAAGPPVLGEDSSEYECVCVCVCVCVCEREREIERGLCLREEQKRGVCVAVTHLFVMRKVSVKRVRDHWGECVGCEGSNYSSLVCQDVGCLMVCVCVCVTVDS